MARVELRNANKTYPNGFEAIPGMSLEIVDGEFLVLVGPSGCGKSTLLRMIAGLERISAGEIHIEERRVNDLEPAERNIAMVFQNYALYPHMSVYNNMAYGLRNMGTAKDEIERRVREAATILELDDGMLQRKPRQLSGGQRQRVAMGRAIVREPAVFLFDEPLSNLDAKLRVQMRVEIKRLQRALSTTSIYVTHDQVEAMTMADRLVVMNEGRAEQVGSPMEVYARPATRFVASFIGSPAMNLLPCNASAADRVRLAANVELDLATPLAQSGDGRELLLGVRPEHFHVNSGGPLSIYVELAEPLGAETLLHGTLIDTDSRITVRVGGDEPVETGVQLGLSVAGERLHVFDAGSGERLN
jgi:sn-glycerol 3-phosphate transport system ATP-binding protein